MTADVRLEEQQAVDEVEKTRAAMREAGRAAMGVSGKEEAAPFWRTLRLNHLSVYTLVALGILVIVDTFQDNGFYILGPEISRALGMPRQFIGLFTVASGLMLTLAALPMAWFVERKPRRAVVAVTTGILWSVITLVTGLVTSPWALLFVILSDGATSGSVAAVHGPLIADTYPTSIRVRVLSQYTSFVLAGGIIGPLLVFLL